MAPLFERRAIPTEAPGALEGAAGVMRAAYKAVASGPAVETAQLMAEERLPAAFTELHRQVGGPRKANLGAPAPASEL